MEIYLMRHISTIWNECGITQGNTDTELSPSAINYAFIKAEEYKNEKFDIIYSSPLLRATQTANIINKFHNTKIVIDKRLTHIDQGIFTGTKWSDLSESEKFLKKQRSSFCKMESWESIRARSKAFLEDILKKHNTSDKILILTHGYNLIFFEDLILNKNVNYAENFSFDSEFKNCEIRKYFLK